MNCECLYHDIKRKIIRIIQNMKIFIQCYPVYSFWTLGCSAISWRAVKTHILKTWRHAKCTTFDIYEIVSWTRTRYQGCRKSFWYDVDFAANKKLVQKKFFLMGDFFLYAVHNLVNLHDLVLGKNFFVRRLFLYPALLYPVSRVDNLWLFTSLSFRWRGTPKRGTKEELHLLDLLLHRGGPRHRRGPPPALPRRHDGPRERLPLRRPPNPLLLRTTTLRHRRARRKVR